MKIKTTIVDDANSLTHKGFILMDLINSRVSFPSLYSGNGRSRISQLRIAKEFLKK